MREILPTIPSYKSRFQGCNHEMILVKQRLFLCSGYVTDDQKSLELTFQSQLANNGRFDTKKFSAASTSNGNKSTIKISKKENLYISSDTAWARWRISGLYNVDANNINYAPVPSNMKK